MLYKM